MAREPHIAVLGAGGLIGHAVATDLLRRGFNVRAMARRFTSAQRHALGDAVAAPAPGLSALLEDADIVVNAVGVLQGPDSDAANRVFPEWLATQCRSPQKLLLHISIPGDAKADATIFATGKRAAERAIAASGTPYAILRPGFVIAEAAYGGSALIRAIAALPFDLPRRESAEPFAATAISDLCETVAHIAERWRGGERNWSVIWEVMEEAPGTVGDIITLFRARNGGPRPLLRLPGWLLAPGVLAGDAVSLLGWRPPLRRTALAEMRRGVVGDPRGWMTDTGIVPLSARQAVMVTPATVQEKWFARLYFLKAVALLVLVIFWCQSGAFALTVSFGAAAAILEAHGFSLSLAQDATIATSLLDIVVGIAIAVRRTSRIGLIAGILVSLGYMTAAAVMTPDLWFEPLGALVKTGPAIVLMLICLALSDNR